MSARRQLPLREWPASDQRAWDELFREGDPLDGCGLARHWSEGTRRTNEKHYSRWLGWLAKAGGLDQTEDPTLRATPERVEAYARSLLAEVAPKTTETYLRDLSVVLKVMQPDQDWRWLTTLTNRLKRWAKPSRVQPLPSQSADELFRILMAELHRLENDDLSNRKAQIAFRDTLLVAVLLCCAPRLKNIAMIQVGTHLFRAGPDWRLSFTAAETKNHRPLDLILPEALDRPMGIWLDKIRTCFPAATDSDALWPACKGRPMAHHTIYDRVRKTTSRLFGTSLSPHAFRTIAATFLSESSPEDALHARPLLGHLDLATTENHYVRANQIHASIRVAQALLELQGSSKNSVPP